MISRFEVRKKVIIIAGPNGAGKTTFARSFLLSEEEWSRFINADMIAAGLSPIYPETASIKAGRVMLQQMTDYVRTGESFTFETTLSGLSYVGRIRDWQIQGYHVSLFFLSLPDVEMAIERVAERVKQGGHSIPETVIRRRFKAGWKNFQLHYRSAVDAWTCYDNSGHVPVLIEWGEADEPGRYF